MEEVQAPANGTLLELLVTEGDWLAVGDDMSVIDTEQASFSL